MAEVDRHGGGRGRAAAIDSPFFDLADADGLRREAERVRGLGYCGKGAIHPRQIPVLGYASAIAARLADVASHDPASLTTLVRATAALDPWLPDLF